MKRKSMENIVSLEIRPKGALDVTNLIMRILLSPIIELGRFLDEREEKRYRTEGMPGEQMLGNTQRPVEPVTVLGKVDLPDRDRGPHTAYLMIETYCWSSVMWADGPMNTDIRISVDFQYGGHLYNEKVFPLIAILGHNLHNKKRMIELHNIMGKGFYNLANSNAISDVYASKYNLESDCWIVEQVLTLEDL